MRLPVVALSVGLALASALGCPQLAFAESSPSEQPDGEVMLEPMEVSCVAHTDGDMMDSFSVSCSVRSLECDVECRAYMQKTGWRDWVSEGQEAGEPDGGRRVEAIAMRLRGLFSADYRIWYRANVKDRGWTGWGTDGEAVGTMGMSLPITDIEVRILRSFEKRPKGEGETLADMTLNARIDGIQDDREVAAFGGFKPGKKALKAVRAAVDQIRSQGHDVGFVMMDLATYKGLACNAGAMFYGASSIKAPYMAAAIESHPKAIKKFGPQVRQTLTYSWDHTYKEMVDEFGTEPLFAWRDELGLDADFGLFSADAPWADYTARDLAKLWVRIYQWSRRTKEGATFCEWSENPQTSTIHEELKGRWRTQSKAGWIETEYSYWQATDDGGLVYAQNGTYVLCILSNIPADFTQLRDLTLALDAAHDKI